jgi:transcriptional regulator with XRE-family HTH domain
VSAIGKRLAEERKRLGCSQSAFAELVGISFSSQRRYEDGRSSPDTAYLEALGKSGVDVNYVLFGIAGDEIVDCPYVATMPLPSGAVFKPITLTECREIASGFALRRAENPDGLRQWFEFCKSCALHPGKPPGSSAASLSDSDIALLAEVLEGIEGALLNHGLSMPPPKKAQAVAMLYRSFKASGKVDLAMIEEAVKLAAD